MEIWKMGLWVIFILSFICFWICWIFCNKINIFFFFKQRKAKVLGKLLATLWSFLGKFWCDMNVFRVSEDAGWCIKGTLAPFIQGLLQLAGNCCLVAKSCPSLFVTPWKGPKQQNFKTLLTKPSWEHQLFLPWLLFYVVLYPGVADKSQVNSLGRLQWWEMQKSEPRDTPVRWISSIHPSRSRSSLLWALGDQPVLTYWRLPAGLSQCRAPVGAWKEGAEWGWVIFGPALNLQLHCGSGFQWSSELLPASPLCDNLYFQIPVMSSAPYLFRHGVARSVFQPKELPWSSWHFLLTDLPLPMPLLNSSKGLPRWH